jgi:hypothetical protein
MKGLNLIDDAVKSMRCLYQEAPYGCENYFED